jgi:hypothetical protein
VNGRHGGKELARLIERSAELKRDLVGFACSPRLERTLAAAMAEAGLEEFDGADAIVLLNLIDDLDKVRTPAGQSRLARQ